MHVRCPHCRHAIEIVSAQELTDVTCPSCGSSFNLLPQTESYTPKLRSIGHFQLLEQLGAGGFGTVYKARDSQLDRFVAIKIPRRDQVEPENVEMFLREARAAAQLRHPGIVSVHEVGRDGETLYIVSDYIEGATLADRLTAGSLRPREAAELLAQAADALHHAHEAGVIHRDLKPSNIMLDGLGRPYLLDFGLAKREAGEITMTVDGKILGTAAYMSPEQARGEAHHVDRRTDVYSLGVILYQLLTGKLPFRGNRTMLLNQVIHDEPPRPRRIDASIPRDLETVCLKCLEKNPSQRYATAAEVANELRRWLDGIPIVARRASVPERVWKLARRNPMGVVVVATLPLAMALAALIVALGVRFDRFADNLVDMFVVVPIFVVLTFAIAAAVVFVPYLIGNFVAWLLGKVRRRQPVSTAQQLPISWVPRSDDSLLVPKETVQRLLANQRRKTVVTGLLGVLLCSAAFSVFASLAVCSPSLRPLTSVHFAIVLAPVSVFILTVLALGALQART